MEMACGFSSSGKGGGAEVCLGVIYDIRRIYGEARVSGVWKRDCVDLVRRVSLLTHFLEEIRDFEKGQGIGEVGSSSRHSCFVELIHVLYDARRLLVAAASNFDVSEDSSVTVCKRVNTRFQCVTIELEKALANFPYSDFEISEDVQDHVKLVKKQLRRAVGRYISDSSLLQSSVIESDQSSFSNRTVGMLDFDSAGKIDCHIRSESDTVFESKDTESCMVDEVIDMNEGLSISSTSNEFTAVESSKRVTVENSTSKNEDDSKNLSCSIPVDFLCPISLELMKDPVTVATGQTYERSSIQRWIDCGNKTCPKTQQKLWHLGLTPNYLLRRLISQWCAKNTPPHPTALVDGKIRQSNGSFRDVAGDAASIRTLVHILTCGSIEDIRAAVADIRSRSRRSTDNRILLAEAGAIPILVNLLSSQDAEILDNAITCILNLSIYENNKELIVLADGIPSIVKIFGTGSMEAKENAAAALFCLSLVEENKITIGASGAIPALVNLLRNGSVRGKKDAATALFSLCTYPRNKGRAIKAGIISPLLKMLTDSSNSFVDESLTVIAILASCHEAKSAMVKTNMIPVLATVLRVGSPRNQENASSILVSLCKKDKESLAWLSQLDVVASLFEITKNGTERARRKALMLLDLLTNTLY